MHHKTFVEPKLTKLVFAYVSTNQQAAFLLMTSLSQTG
jgi:hypothetical protein